MEWTIIRTFGFSYDIWARGKEHQLVNRNTGQVVIRYTVEDVS